MLAFSAGWRTIGRSMPVRISLHPQPRRQKITTEILMPLPPRPAGNAPALCQCQGNP